MITEQELRQLFKNNSDCYADTHSFKDTDVGVTLVEEGDVIQAMTEDRFVHVARKIGVIPTEEFKVGSEVTPKLKQWKRYRFKTRSVEDYRPLIFNPKYAWWCSGEDGMGEYAVIIAYLPKDEDLLTYWDDAFDIEFTEEESITFSGRFPKPDYFIE